MSQKSSPQQSKGRQQGNELLNFYFARTPQNTSAPARPRNNNNNNNYGNRNKKQSQQRRQQYHRTAEDRASARRKAANNMFPLHSSSEHAFVLVRKLHNHNNYSYTGPDHAVSWESVKLVKHLLTDQDTLDCPICLDSLQCARITKCGHCFCLPCLIHHVQSLTNAAAPKCPCCSIPLFLEDVRPVQLVQVQPPTQIGKRGVFVKLHRGHAAVTPYVPQVHHPRRGTVSHGAPTDGLDPDAKFSRFNYMDPASFQSLLEFNRSELSALKQETTTTSVSTLQELCLGLAIQMVDQDLRKLATEMEQELQLQERYSSSASGMYQSHPRHLLFEKTDNNSSCNVQQLDENNNASATTRRTRGDSVVSASSAASTTSTNLQGGSMYLNQDEYAFYQAEDGSLCFLSGFNMNCLRTEYSATLTDDGSQDRDNGQSKDSKPNESTGKGLRPPLPDRVEGRVVEVERVHLTEETRQRRRFLSHLPLYTDICFVELSLGHVLSNRTKKVFKKEFNKRNQARAKSLQAEKRADERERRKEEARINELKARIQRIDPNDDFFQAPTNAGSEPEPTLTGEDFGPTISSSSAVTSTTAADDTAEANTGNTRPEMSFSRICRAGDDFPTLGSDRTDTNFPALGSSPASPRREAPPPRPWGASVKTAPPASDATTASEVAIETEGKRKKGKPKKIVLFSTGGHRGGTY